MKKESIQGKEISVLTFINRIHALEGIIFELKEVLKHYQDLDDRKSIYKGQAETILKKYNKSWTELYDEIDKKYENQTTN